MVFLGNCTGTLIAPDRVLTAAHCASVIDPDSTRAVIGTNDVGGNKGFVDGVLTPVVPPASAHYPIKGFVGHPGFPDLGAPARHPDLHRAVRPMGDQRSAAVAGAGLHERAAREVLGAELAVGMDGVRIGAPGSSLAKKCGEAHLPAVWMRVSHYTSFLTDPTPVFAPHTHARPTIRGAHTLTCSAPAFKGSRAKLSYRWGIARFRLPSREQPRPITPLRGATSRRFTPTKATHGKRIACAVTARNSSGSWTAYSKSIDE